MDNLKNYKQDITAISAANGNVDIGVATDMFIANIRNAGNPDLPYYEGADNVDYAALRGDLATIVDAKTAFLDEWGRELGWRK
ncbi:MAG: hypothetical protein ACK5LX_02180 [Oscillospiraceae bacterium]